MSQTPASTPSRAKNLPLIVDIAIGNDGKQLYQVHESAKGEVKDMPRSSTGFEKAAEVGSHDSMYNTQPNGSNATTTVYSNMTSDGNGPVKSDLGSAPDDVGNLDLAYSESMSAIDQYKQDTNDHPNQNYHSSITDTKLPITVKKEIDNLSPTSLEREPGTYHNPPQYYPFQSQGHSHEPVSSFQPPHPPPPQTYFYDSEAMDGHGPHHGNPMIASGTSDSMPIEYHVSNAAEDLANSGLLLDSASKVPESDIWSEDVSEAFEEILAIIPKNGLNKIKISGRSCGRNELISDYILTKTGKHRSRKQVSSHIQVIKNLGQKQNIIKLIKDGPVFNTEEERIANSKKFEAIFSKINLNKSLGLNGDSLKAPENSSVVGLGYSRKRSYEQLSTTATTDKRQKSAPIRQYAISNFFISLYDDYNSSPITLCIQKDNSEFKNLKLKGDANISTRFPGLLQFQDNNIPIIHTMVNLKYPTQVASPEFFEKGLKTNISVQELNYGAGGSDGGALSIFSSVYSYGNEVLKFNEENFMLGKNHPFLHKFWLFYLSKLVGKSDEDIANALKSLTIKQVAFSPSKKQANSGIISKLRIKAVLLWEFASATDLNDATTVSTKLLLPSAESLPLNYNHGGQPLPVAHQFSPEPPITHHQGDSGVMSLPSATEYLPVNSNVPGNPNLPGGVNYTTVPTSYGPPDSATAYQEQPLGGHQGNNQFQVQSKFQNLQEVANQNLSTRSASYPMVQPSVQKHLHIPLQPPPPPPPIPAQTLQPQMIPSFDNVATMPIGGLNDLHRYPHPSAKVDLMTTAIHHKKTPGGYPPMHLTETNALQPIIQEEGSYQSPPLKEPPHNLGEDGSGYKPVYYPDTYVSDLS